MIDLQFPVSGHLLPVDHGYNLYSALSAQLAWLHKSDTAIAIAPIRGQWQGNGLLRLGPRRSQLCLRVPVEVISSALALAGKSLVIAGHEVQLGVPSVHALVPAPSLVANLVTIKKFTEAAPFLAAARRQLDDLHVVGVLGVPVVTGGAHQGQPRRKILRIHDKAVVGFTLEVTNLTADESIRLQEHGLGGRRRMGCGFFVPLRPRAS